MIYKGSVWKYRDVKTHVVIVSADAESNLICIRFLNAKDQSAQTAWYFYDRFIEAFQWSNDALPKEYFPHELATFKYSGSQDGVNENLLILLHGLGDSEKAYYDFGKRMELPQTGSISNNRSHCQRCRIN